MAVHEGPKCVAISVARESHGGGVRMRHPSD